MGLKWDTCLIYLDDVDVFSKIFDEHLDKVLTAFNQGLRLKIKKCNFGMTTLRVLGHVVDQFGVYPDSEKLAPIKYMNGFTRTFAKHTYEK